MGHRQRAFGAFLGGGYSNRVLATAPIAYWKLDEGSGTTITDSSGNAYNGTYTGVTWDGTQSSQNTLAPYWDGTNDYGNVYSAGLGTAFNFDESTILLCVKISSSVWVDGVARELVNIQRTTAADARIRIFKATTSNTITLLRFGNATSKTITVGSLSDTEWFCLAISASIAGGGLLGAGELKAYKSGAQIGTTQTANIASIGSGLSTTGANLGAANTTPTAVHSGYLAHVAIYNRPMSADILALMTV